MLASLLLPRFLPAAATAHAHTMCSITSLLCVQAELSFASGLGLHVEAANKLQAKNFRV